MWIVIKHIEQNGALQRHVQSHDPKHECEYCSKRFSYEYLMTRHQKACKSKLKA